MIQRLPLIILFLFFRAAVVFAANNGYTAEFKEMGRPMSVSLFSLDVSKLIVGEKENVTALTRQGTELVLEEKAVLNRKNYDVLEYRVNNYQTQETGKLIFSDKSVWIEYSEKNKPAVLKEIKKTRLLLTPANFEQFMRYHFNTLFKERSMVVDFLIWDRRETVAFKITYLGKTMLNDVEANVFKMNLNNFLLAAFVDPIKIWYSEDMNQILRYSGRVAVKRKKADGSLGPLDADVIYKYK